MNCFVCHHKSVAKQHKQHFYRSALHAKRLFTQTGPKFCAQLFLQVNTMSDNSLASGKGAEGLSKAAERDNTKTLPRLN